MRNTLFAAVMALAVATAGFAHAQPSAATTGNSPHGGSATALNALMADWDRVGFSSPGKPIQSRVSGRDGHVTSGPEYRVMVSLIRSAFQDSDAGREQDSLMKIAKVRRLLGR